MEPSRRTFLGAAAVSTAVSARRVLGANDRIRIAVIGTGGRGQWLMKTLAKLAPDEIQFVAVCDVYDARRAEAMKIAGETAEQYVDYKQMLRRKDVDAVIVATPDHWHATMTVDALNAGKDVYVEKPMVHYPKDGQAIVKAARANQRVVQVGMQGRALPNFVEAKEKYIDTGIIGKVGLARTWYTSNRGYIATPPAGMEKKPEGLDWERWLGPGPKVPWNPDIYFSPYKWLHYDGGMIMGIAIHVVDSAHHWLSLRNPISAVAGGGTYHYKDGRDTPDVVTFILDYPQQVTVTFEAECLTAPGVRTSAGVELRGTGGALWAERYIRDIGYVYTPNTAFSKEPPAQVPFASANAENILRNWLDSIRDRKKPVANEEEGYYSSVACFMANRAYRTRSRVTWNGDWNLPAA
jgi:predicted dehydrogenase